MDGNPQIHVGRNAPCPCGSGKRYKDCCGVLGDRRPASVVHPTNRRAEIQRLQRRAEEHYGKGNLREAITLYEEILKHDPDRPDIFAQLAAARLEGDQPALAAELVERALAGGQSVGALFYLQATIFDKLEKPEQALAAYVKLLQADPDYPDRQNVLSRIFSSPEKVDQLFDRQLRPLAHQRSNMKMLDAIGTALYRQKKYEQAEILFKRILDVAPRESGILIDLGIVLSKLSRFDEAERCFRMADAVDSDDALVHIAWADMEERRNHTDKAFELAQRAIALAPDEPQNIISYVIISKYYRRQKAFEQAWRHLERATINKSLDKDLLHIYHHERGQVLDKLNRYDEAFAAYRQSKLLIREMDSKRYDREETLRKFSRLEKFFNPACIQRLGRFAASKARTFPQPIFILGFPRSGTTLTEQILGSHPNISAAGELVFMGELAEQGGPLLGSTRPYPEYLSDLEKPGNERALERFRDEYLARVAKMQCVRPGANWFTDKMPLNEIHLGLIKLVFPDSPIIHVIRHPLDACLSAYFQPFSTGHLYSRRLEDLAFHYVEVMKLAYFYKSHLEVRCLDIHYETLVRDPETQIKRMLALIGEPWDARCLEFHKNTRVARTASYAQVTEQLYTASLYRYKHYRNQVNDLIPGLRPVIDSLGYAVD